MNEFVKEVEVELGLEFWISRPFVSAQLSKSIIEADVVLVPWEYEPDTTYVFPDGTSGAAQFFSREFAKHDLSIEICTDDESYQELRYTVKVLRIVEIVVTLAIAPVAAGIIANFIFERLGRRRAKKATVESTLTIRTTEKNKSVKLEYKGQLKLMRIR